MSANNPMAKVPAKAPAGIAGFGEIAGAGSPHGRTALLEGGQGSGKTVFALQFLVHSVRNCREPGISGESPASDRPLR